MSTVTQRSKGAIPLPDMAALLRATQDELAYRMYCHLPGRIERFYADTQTADVSLPIQKFYDSKPVAMPLLVKCPVFFLSGGGTGRVTMPVATGDSCLVAVSDRDIDTWWLTGNAAPPKSRRVHDLSDSFVFVGFRHKGNVVPDYSTTNVEVMNLGSKISVGTNIKETASAGAKLELAAKAKLANNSTSLKTVLDALVDAIKAQVDTSGDTLNPATRTALDAVKTQIASLLDA